METKKRKPSELEQYFNPNIPPLHFRDSRLLRMRRLSSELQHLTGKLERISARLHRLPLEAPELKPDLLFKRVMEKRRGIQNELRALRREIGSQQTAGSQRKAASCIYLGDVDVSLRFSEAAAQYEMKVTDLRKRCQPGDPCVPFTGSAPFYICTIGRTEKEWNSVDEDTMYTQGLLGSGHLNSTLYYASIMDLIDDASWLTNDSPNRVLWRDSSIATLPCVSCDSTVFATFFINVQTQVLDVADDANTLHHEFDVRFWYPEGGWSGDYYEDVVSERSVTNREGAWFNSGWLQVVVSFLVKPGVIPWIAAYTYTELTAQDGELRVAANWEITDAVYQIAPRIYVAPATYRIDVKTGDVNNAGTNSRVHIQLFGTDGESRTIRLDNPGRDDFRRGAFDSFTVSLDQDLGNLLRARVWHDNSGEKPGWFLDYVQVWNLSRNLGWGFPCYRWLAVNADDGHIDRVLDVYPS